MNISNIDTISNLVSNVMSKMARHWNADNLSEEQVIYIVKDCDGQLSYNEANSIARCIINLINIHNSIYGNLV